MVDFASFKKNRSQMFEKLNAHLSQINSKNYIDEEENKKYWKPTRDKSGNGFAIIRFLPAPPGEDMPFVRLWYHGFQGPTGLWYIQNSLTTIGKPDPVYELNAKLFNSSNDNNSPERNQARAQRRKLHYISNIYVIKDPGNPENEGKVFLFKYGKKIFDKVNDLMNPSFEDEKKVNPFDFWEGANFRLKIRQVDGYVNYDKSEFDAPGPLLDDDKELERIWRQEYSLQEIIHPKNFKSYEELKALLHRVLGLTPETSNRTNIRSSAVVDDIDDDDLDMSTLAKSNNMQKIKEQPRIPVSPVDDIDDEEDPDLELFKQLAKKAK
jgi:hypothetical protein